MKLIPSDLLKVRAALSAARLAGINSVVISNGRISGVHDEHIAAIFSPLELSIDSSISLGIVKLSELEKRLALFTGDILVEGEVNDANKVRKLNIKAKTGKIEFRCTDEKLITHPKSNMDEPGIVLTISKPEIALISKGIKTLGAELLTLQVKRDGAVRIECSDVNQDIFEVTFENGAEFIDDEYPYVNPFKANGGVLLPLFEQLVKDNDTAQVFIMKTGNILIQAHGHDVFVVPRIQHGE